MTHSAFEQRARSGDAWHIQAAILKQAADLLWEASREDPAEGFRRTEQLPVMLLLLQPYREARFGLLPTFELTAGLALENLTKGVLVTQDPEKWVHGDRLRFQEKNTTGHELERLIAETGTSLDTRQTDLVRRLSEAVLWLGRYPTPRSAARPPLPDDLMAIPLDHWEVFDRLYNSLRLTLMLAQTSRSCEELTGFSISDFYASGYLP